jgi:hypothetical protein
VRQPCSAHCRERGAADDECDIENLHQDQIYAALYSARIERADQGFGS